MANETATPVRMSSVDLPGCYPGGFFANHHGTQILEHAANHVWEPLNMTREGMTREKAAEMMDDRRHEIYAIMEALDAEDDEEAA